MSQSNFCIVEMHCSQCSLSAQETPPDSPQDSQGAIPAARLLVVEDSCCQFWEVPYFELVDGQIPVIEYTNLRFQKSWWFGKLRIPWMLILVRCSFLVIIFISEVFIETQLPIAAITDYSKLCDLRQQKLLFYHSGVWTRSPWALAGLCLVREAWGIHVFGLPSFQKLLAFLGSWLLQPSSTTAKAGQVLLTCHHCDLFRFPHPSFKDPCDHTGST